MYQNLKLIEGVSWDSLIEANRDVRISLLENAHVEGFDVNVLCGSMESIIRFKPIIIFEYCLATNLKNNISLFKDIKKKMLESGYRFYVIRHDFLVDFVEEKENQGNVRILCVPKE